MWNISESESTQTNLKFKIEEDNTPISHHRFLELLNGSGDFRTFYNAFLAESGYEAFLWENKPVTSHNLEEQYECNILDSPYLAGKAPDTETFRQYFEESKNVVTFLNLGRDARLIVPCPQQDKSTYPHIGTFVRNGNKQQIDDFWRITAEQMLSHIGEQPRWLSTSGLGVFWLHARIDSKPKYYQTVEYKQI